tara:strand:+ start:1659 stop:2282 length:624 start_codon:yes stop_codon:yes gene_type:complete
MIVMPANTQGFTTGYIAGKYDGRIAHLYSPDGWRRPKPYVKYALDNGRFSESWSERDYLKMLDAAASHRDQPIWALVPDVVGDREATIREWDVWAPRIAAYRWPLAFAVQDGCQPTDVPEDAEVIFVGGTTKWKRKSLAMWCDSFKRVHVGRVNTNKWLWECDEAGAESCDGTGWMRGNQDQLKGLVDYLERSSQGLGNQRGRKLWQ